MSQAIILAAGESSRFWPLNRRHKSLIKIMGRPLIWWTIEGLRKSGISDIVVVQQKDRDIEKELRDDNIKYVIQSEPKGMGDALWQAKKLIKGPFIVLNAERIDIAEIIESAKLKTQKPEIKAVLIGQKTKTPQIFGIMEIKGDRVLHIAEKPKKSPPSNIRAIGVYFLEPEFFKYYLKIKKHHYNFEKALSSYMKKNEVRVHLFERKEEAVSLKYPWHIFSITKYLFDKNLGRNEVRLGKNVKIFKGAIVKGPCYVGDNCTIGNNAIVRDYTDLEEGAVVGALAEVTRSILQKGAHLHSGYFGDSVFGEGCRVGAGTVTANRRFDRDEIKVRIKKEKISTHLTFLGTIAGDNVRIGINVSLMPGALIGPDSLIWPNSVFPENLARNKKSVKTKKAK